MSGYCWQGMLQQSCVGMFEKCEGDRISRLEVGPVEEKRCGITAHTEVIDEESRQKKGWNGKEIW